MPTGRTLPRGIARINREHRDTGQLGFVGEKLAELSKRPGVQYDALWRVPSGHSLDPRADVLEVFKRHCSFRAFGQSYEAFGDNVVGIGCEAPFLPAQRAQPKPGGAGVLALELAAESSVAKANVLDVRPAVDGAVAIDGDVGYAKINPKHAVYFGGRRLVHDTDGKEVEDTRADHEVGFAPSRGQQRELAVAAHKRDRAAARRVSRSRRAGRRCPTAESGRRRQSSRAWSTNVVCCDRAGSCPRPWPARG